jgi:hypothetical protein
MRRRVFLGLVGGAAAAWPLAARAQQIKTVPRVGVLWHAGSADEEEVYLSVLQKAFRDLGYVEGRNIALEHRFPAEQADRFRSMARELAESKVDVIVLILKKGFLFLVVGELNPFSGRMSVSSKKRISRSISSQASLRSLPCQSADGSSPRASERQARVCYYRSQLEPL